MTLHLFRFFYVYYLIRTVTIINVIYLNLHVMCFITILHYSMRYGCLIISEINIYHLNMP